MELTLNLQDPSKLQSLFALLNTFTLNQQVGLTVKYAHNASLTFPANDEARAAAWRELQAIVSRNKLRVGEEVWSPEEEDAFILSEIKAARAEERAQL